MHFLRKIIFYHHKIIFINYPLELVHNILSKKFKNFKYQTSIKRAEYKE